MEIEDEYMKNNHKMDIIAANSRKGELTSALIEYIIKYYR